jgi:Na+/melibiose symporter-like transporter
MEGSQRLGAVIMLASVLETVVFLWALSRRSYLALALPITIILGALNALAFWIGWTMFAASEEEEEELEAALGEVPEAAQES